MAYNSDKGPQHTGDIQYEGDPNDVQIDFENDQIILRTGGAPRVSVVNTQMSASGIFRNVGSISGSGDLAVSGTIHATTFYGSGAGLTSVTATTVTIANDGADRLITAGGDSTLTGEALLTFDPSNSVLTITNGTLKSTNVSGSGTLRTALGITSSTDIVASGSMHATTFYGSGAGLTDVGTMSSFSLAGDGGSAQTVENGNTVTIAGGTGLTSTAAATDTVSVALDNTAVTPGSYNSANITVDAQGRLTAAANGALPTSLSGTTAQLTTGVETSGYLKVSGSTTLKGALSSSSTIKSAGSISSSGDLAVTGAIHATTFYGSGAGLTSLPSATSLSGTTAQLTIGVETSGYLKVSGSSTLAGPATIKGTGSFSNIVATGSISGSSTLQAVGATTLGSTLAVTGNVNIGGPNESNSALYVKSPDNSVVAMFKSPSHDTILAITGSGQVAVGGVYLDAKLNVSGSDPDKLIAAAGTSRGDTFYVSASGETFVSGSVILQDIEPTIYFSGSDGSTILGQIGYNSSDNILIQNNVVNKHIVFKASDAGTLREGFRIDGAVPEVVVNQGSDSLVDFRVESDSNTHMLFVDGTTNKVGINTDTPAEILTVVGNISGSGTTRLVGSLSGSGDIAVSGAVHATTYYGDGSNLTGLTVSALSGTTAQLTIGVETSGYLKVSGSTTLAGATTLKGTGSFSNIVATGSISGSSTLQVVAATTLGNTLAVSGTVFVAEKIEHAGDADTYISFTTDDINFQAGGVNFLDLTEDTQNEATFNEGGVDVDFRVESENDTHMLFVDAANDAVSIGVSTDAPAAVLEVVGDGAAAKPTFTVIHAENTNNAVNITADSITTAKALRISADALTTGNALYIDDDSSSTGTRNTAIVIQNDAAALNATALAVQSDGGVTGVNLDKNYSDLTEASIVGLNIDFDKTGASTSDNNMFGIQLDMDNATATNGNNYMYGLYITPTLTQPGGSGGGSFVYGAHISAQGDTNGASSLVQGARIEAAGGDFNYGIQLDVEDGPDNVDLRIESSVDNGDYFQIQTTTHGATTITTQDDNATAAHLTFNVDGDITLDPAGGDVFVDGNVSGSGTLYSAGAATFSSTIAATGSVSAAGLYSTGLISGSNGLHIDAPATLGATLSVTGSIGVGVPVAKTALDVHHDPTALANDTGGGDVVKFGTGTLTAGKLYYLHSGSSWEQTDMIGEASGGLGMLGIALGSNPAVDGILIRGFFDAHSYLSGNFAVGTTLYISAPGYLSTMRPSGSAEVVRVLGSCTTTPNVIYFNPSSDYLVIA